MTADLQSALTPSAADEDTPPPTEGVDVTSPDAASQVEVDEFLVEEVSIDGLCGVY